MVLTSEYGFKHCFQKEGLEKPIDDNCNFVVIYRNPYDWLRSLHRIPHHAPEMMGKSFSVFLRHPWRSYIGKEWISKILEERTSIIKPENLREEYPNVIKLREDKIRLFESFKNMTNKIVYLRYEDLKENPEESIDYLAKCFGIETRKNIRNINSYKRTNKRYRPTRYLRIRKVDLNYINEQLNWELENQIGYSEADYHSKNSDHIIYSIQSFMRRLFGFGYRQYFFIKHLFVKEK